MVQTNKCFHYGVVHCPSCGGAVEFDFGIAIQQGQVVDMYCPWCNCYFSTDIFSPGVYHRIVNPIDEAFR